MIPVGLPHAGVSEGPHASPTVHWGIGAVQTRVASMVRKRHPTIANAMIAGIDRDPAPCFQSVRNCEQVWVDSGLEIPLWIEMASNRRLRGKF